MNTRLIIPLLCVGAVALACSTRVHTGTTDKAATGASRPALATVAQVGTAKKHSKQPAAIIKLASSFGVHVDAADPHASGSRGKVQFALDVTNVGDKHVELAFPSGQAYDFVVVDSLGREVWRWTKGRMFTQTMQTKLLATGDQYRVAESWDQPAAHGRYTAIATLNSSNYPVEERVDFEVK